KDRCHGVRGVVTLERPAASQHLVEDTLQGEAVPPRVDGLSAQLHRGAVMFTKIVSGGQTGVDRAALDVALEVGLPCGGWGPQGRRAEDGPLPERYPLRETASAAYPARTARNVREADGTLILTRGEPDRGTALTARL